MREDLNGVGVVALVELFSEVDSVQGWENVFRSAETLLLPENAHVRASLSDEYLSDLLEMLAIEDVPDYGGMQAHFGPMPGFERLKDVARVAFWGVLFREIVESEHYEPAIQRYLENRFGEMQEVWRKGWVEEHGTEPPAGEFQILAEAKRAGFSTTDLKAGKSRLWEVFATISGRLQAVRDKESIEELQMWVETMVQSLPDSPADKVRDLALKLGVSQEGVSVDLKKATITVNGKEYPAKAHWCTAVQALIDEGGRNLTGPELRTSHGCAGKRWDREFSALKKAIPALDDRILSDGPLGYRIIDF